MARRQYTDEQKAEILALLDANDGNVKRTARDAGIPVSTLRGWANGRGTNQGVAKLRPQKRGALADEFRELIYKAVAVLPGKLDEARVSELSTLIGTLTDKIELLEGRATERTDVTGVQIYLPDNGRG